MSNRTGSPVVWLRRLVQAAGLLLFVFLFMQTEGRGNDDLGYPVRMVLDCSPLIALASALATWVLPAAWLAAAVVLLVTLLGGRIFCGWLCPMGTIHHVIGVLGRQFRGRIAGQWRRAKYYLLFVLLAGACVSVQLAGVFDPLSLLIRSCTVAVNPVANSVIEAVFVVESWAPKGAIRDGVEAAHRFVTRHVLAFKQPRFDNAYPIAFLFLLLLALNLFEVRFWCRYICPLGALLGTAGRWPLMRLRVDEKCNGCGLCALSCPSRADPAASAATRSGAAVAGTGSPSATASGVAGGGQQGPVVAGPVAGATSAQTWRSSECMMCGNCTAVCPQRALSFRLLPRDPAVPAAPLDLGRRRLVLAGVAGLVSSPVLRTVPLPHAGGPPNPKLIRPPGSCAEPEFLARCVKCGECMKVCLTNGLHPAGLEHGLEAIWTPVLQPRLGYCEYRCTLCGQVCPTQAIKRLTLDDKAKVKVGLAMVDRSRCLPHAYSTPCIVCEEVCPLPRKAIWVETVNVKTHDGGEITVQQPHIDASLCTGCGICEAKCPVVDTPAIRVSSIGESRSTSNQLILQ